MRQSIKDMRKKMKSSPGVNVHLEIPRDLYHRIQALAIADESRSNTKVYKREKVLECLLAGIESLETLDRKS